MNLFNKILLLLLTSFSFGVLAETKSKQDESNKVEFQLSLSCKTAMSNFSGFIAHSGVYMNYDSNSSTGLLIVKLDEEFKLESGLFYESRYLGHSANTFLSYKTIKLKSGKIKLVFNGDIYTCNVGE